MQVQCQKQFRLTIRMAHVIFAVFILIMVALVRAISALKEGQHTAPRSREDSLCNTQVTTYNKGPTQHRKCTVSKYFKV